MVEPRKLPVVAIVLASAAFVAAIVAIGLIAIRGAGSDGATGATTASIRVVDRSVKVADIVALTKLPAAQVTGDGARPGPELQQALGLDPDDTIVAIMGRKVAREQDVRDSLFSIAVSDASTIYVELVRGKQPVLARWKVDGDLRTAMLDRAGLGSIVGNQPSPTTPDPSLARPSLSVDPDPIPTTPDPVPDPAAPATDMDAIVATIKRIDDTHVEIPESTVDAIVSNPMAFMKGARVVPAMKNGKPEGIKLYAIRPSSPYARMNFLNGDTLVAVNGYPLDTVDKGLEIYTKLRTEKKFEIDIIRRGSPMKLHVKVTP